MCIGPDEWEILELINVERIRQNLQVAGMIRLNIVVFQARQC
jgi:hypothetical protein